MPVRHGMSNSYFQFKQFRIEQDQCAMKVTTDACIQGAWTPIAGNAESVLDIGAGTGLLSLMLAQRKHDAIIAAVEYDRQAAIQATQNFSSSVWADRLNVIAADVRGLSLPHKYDLIISNPPFFQNSLQSKKEQSTLARHTVSLSYKELAHSIVMNMAEGGYASVLLPLAEYGLFRLEAMEVELFDYMKLLIRHTHRAVEKRVVGLFSTKHVNVPVEEVLVIKDDGNYTDKFTGLLAPFYLDL